MSHVKPELVRAAREHYERLTTEPRTLGYTELEGYLMTFGALNATLVESCREMARILAALRGSKKITLTEEQHRALQEPYARAVAAITAAGVQP